MSAKLQTLRSLFSKGDEVLVERRKYGDRQTVHRGVIRELHESMAVVHFPGKKGATTEMLPYKRLRHVPPPPEQKKGPGVELVLRAVPPAFKKIASAADAEAPKREEPSMPIEARVVSPKQLQISPAQQQALAAGINPEIAAWMDMGTTLVDGLRTKARTLRTDSERLAHEAQRLADESDHKLEEAEQIEAQLNELEKFSRVVQHALGKS